MCLQHNLMTNPPAPDCQEEGGRGVTIYVLHDVDVDEAWTAMRVSVTGPGDEKSI